MSLIGKTLIKIPEGVSYTFEKQIFKVSGPNGSLEKVVPGNIQVKKEDVGLRVEMQSNDRESNVMHGTFRSIMANMVLGVSKGWEKKLELVGTGYRAEVNGRDLVLTVGHSHPVRITPPENVTFKVEKSDITVSGPDKDLVGNISARIRAVRPPDPYKGKGIKYKNEVIRRKAGKAAKAAGAGA